MPLIIGPELEKSRFDKRIKNHFESLHLGRERSNVRGRFLSAVFRNPHSRHRWTRGRDRARLRDSLRRQRW